MVLNASFKTNWIIARNLHIEIFEFQYEWVFVMSNGKIVVIHSIYRLLLVVHIVLHVLAYSHDWLVHELARKLYLRFKTENVDTYLSTILSTGVYELLNFVNNITTIFLLNKSSCFLIQCGRTPQISRSFIQLTRLKSCSFTPSFLFSIYIHSSSSPFALFAPVKTFFISTGGCSSEANCLVPLSSRT